jgi:uncharacterized protein
MKEAYSKGISRWGQFGILIGMIGGCLIIGGILSFVIWTAMTGGSAFSMEKDMLKPQNLNAVLVLQIVSTVLVFFLPAVLFAFICYRRGWTYLGFTGSVNIQQLLCATLIAICVLPLIAGLGELNKAIPLPPNLKLRFDAAEKSYTESISQIAQVKTLNQYLASLLVIAAMPAIVEETLFRGALQNLFTRWFKGPWIAIIITSILFSAIHLSWYGFIPRFALGVILGILFYYGQSIWLNILAHFLNNAIIVTQLYILTQRGQKIDLAADEHFPLWVAGIGLVLVVALLSWFIRSSPPQPKEEEIVFDMHNPFAKDVE